MYIRIYNLKRASRDSNSSILDRTAVSKAWKEVQMEWAYKTAAHSKSYTR
jgi:hypothetical protein